MDGWRDTPTNAWLWGLILPLLIVALVIVNLAVWQVYWPNGERSSTEMIRVYTDTWRVVGTVILKLGFAGALFSWFWIANLKPVENSTQLYFLIAIIVCVTGFGTFVAGFFV